VRARPHINIRPAATADVDDSASFISGRNFVAGIRFLAAFDQALATLADFPEIGTPYPLPNPALEGLRFWSLPRFENWVVFYVVRGDTIEVLRVLHSARDIPSILEE